MKIEQFKEMKLQGKKISVVTCYDFWSAKLINKTPINCILVGDTLAMVMHGFETTVFATVDMMVMHLNAVVKGAPKKWIIADMPFLSYRQHFSKTMDNVQQLMQTGAHGVKLEGCQGNLKLIEYLCESGIPVFGHLGLTPQSIHQLGGFKVQGQNPHSAQTILKEAQQLEQAGCTALFLECIPRGLSQQISQTLTIPTIGIGAGLEVDGQVLVLQDMLGLQPEFKARFYKPFLNGAVLIEKALTEFDAQVKQKQFPCERHSYA